MTADHWGYEKEQQPDIVEVIRCKYCDHWETAYDADKAEHGLCYGHRFSMFITPADGYCYKGARRGQWSNISKAE